MNGDIYLLHPPEAFPTIPAYWSFTSLKEFELCELRWALSRASFVNTAGSRYPSQPSISSARGNVIHSVIAEFEKEYRAHGGSRRDFFKRFGLRDRVRHAIASAVAEEIQTNPRTGPAKAITPDEAECINQIKRFVLSLTDKRFSISSEKRHSFSGPTRKREGAEVEITIDDPRLVAYVDWFADGKVVEIKSGEPRDEHIEQALFYAALVYRKHRTLPQSVEVFYGKQGRSLTLSDIDIERCEETLNAVVASIVSADKRILSNQYTASENETCPA